MWTIEIERQRAMRLILGDEFYTAYVLAESEGLQIEGTEEHLHYIGDNLHIKNNADKFFEYLKDNKDEVNNEISLVINKMAVDILARALRYVPVASGRLRDSAYIKKSGDTVTVGFNCPYALYVHEVAYNRHKKPTRYKFLEDAAYETVSKYLKSLKNSFVLFDVSFTFNESGIACLISKRSSKNKNQTVMEIREQYKRYRNNNVFINTLKKELKNQKNLPDNLYDKLISYVEYHSNRGAGKRASTVDILRSFAERVGKGTI